MAVGPRAGRGRPVGCDGSIRNGPGSCVKDCGGLALEPLGYGLGATYTSCKHGIGRVYERCCLVYELRNSYNVVNDVR